ncbi:MAG: polyphenol oxidase family protein [Marmoricola sp.]
MYLARTSLGPVDLAFTARDDGAGPGGNPLDLALGPAGSGPSAALARVAEDFAPGAGIAEMRQVHGNDVQVVGDAPDAVPACDALVTDRPEVTLVVRVADCVPVLLADPERGVIGAVHAGRNGVAHGVVSRALTTMADLGATSVTAWVGPHVCGACYEVPAALQAEVAALVPETPSTTRWGTPGLDLGAGVRAQLLAAGAQLLGAPTAELCTMEEPRAWSHRRDGAAAGRMAGLVRRRA